MRQRKRLLLFQFLIGTVKTCEKLYGYIPGDKFQFLIGTVKTRFIGKVGRFCPMFQFLIGTVKTYRTWYLVTADGEVSIPHRYCKNYLR